MGNCRNNFRSFLLILTIAATYASAFAQTPNMTVQDSAANGTAKPLVLVQGGAASSTQGLEITGQTTSGAAGTAPSLSYVTSGLGGLSLVQLGTTSTGVGSPIFSLCAQQEISTVLTPECWYFQVSGGNGNNVPDVLILSRTSTQPNVTLQVPGALNFAAGDSAHGGQLTISGVPTNATDLSSKPVTVVGGFTSDTTSSAKAAALQLFPGFLNASPPSSVATALEGSLQIGMAVKGNGTQGLLACYGSTSQTAIACSGVATPLLGAYFTVGNGSTNGSNGVITPPGRATVTSSASGAWAAGTPVCRDPDTSMAHLGLSLIEPSNASCPIGQAVGVAVGDPSGTTTSHVIDLDFSDQGVGSSGNANTYATASSSLATAPAGNLLASDGSGNVKDSGTVSGGFFWAFCNGTVGAVNGTAYIFFPSQTSTTTCTASSSGGANTEMPMPVACTARNLAVAAGTAGAVAGSSIKLYRNGAATSLVCALGTNTKCIDNTDTVTFAAQDTWSVRAVAGQASDTMANLKATFQCD